MSYVTFIDELLSCCPEGELWSGTYHNTYNFPCIDPEAFHTANFYVVGPGTLYPCSMTKKQVYELFYRVRKITGSATGTVSASGGPVSANITIGSANFFYQNPNGDESEFVCYDSSSRILGCQENIPSDFDSDDTPPTTGSASASLTWRFYIWDDSSASGFGGSTPLLRVGSDYYPLMVAFANGSANANWSTGVGTPEIESHGGGTGNVVHASWSEGPEPGVAQTFAFDAVFTLHGVGFIVPVYKRLLSPNDLDGATAEVTLSTMSIIADTWWTYDPGDGGGGIWNTSTGIQERAFPY